jgi:hypothetical protein
MKKVVLFLIVILGLQLILTEAMAHSIYVIVNDREQESIDTVVAKFTTEYDLYYKHSTEAYKKYLKVWNPHVANWNKLTTGTRIYIESPSLPLSAGEVPPNSYSAAHYNFPHIFEHPQLYFVFTSSKGTFEEKLLTPKVGNITSSQNSPYSFGLAGTVELTSSENYLSASSYWSKLQATPLTGDAGATTLATPSEYGFNTYFGHPLTHEYRNFSIYGGIDFENFSTYNTVQFINHADIAFNQNKLFYGTFGLEQHGSIFNQHFNFKLSIAQSLISNTSSTDPADRFSGLRLLFFANYKMLDRFSVHMLYKRHILSGTTNLTISRLGFGVSYLMF